MSVMEVTWELEDYLSAALAEESPQASLVQWTVGLLALTFTACKKNYLQD